MLAEDPLIMAEEQLMSLQEIATGEVGTKTARGVDAAGDGAPDDAEPSNDGEFDLDVEVTDPDHPRPVPPKKTAREQAWAWLSGATRATVDKTLEVSKYAADTGVEIAKSEESEESARRRRQHTQGGRVVGREGREGVDQQRHEQGDGEGGAEG